MVDIAKVVSCYHCGRIELTHEEYMYQLLKANSTWFCPKCGGNADWIGEFYNCEKCNNPVDIEEMICECGHDNTEYTGWADPGEPYVEEENDLT